MCLAGLGKHVSSWGGIFFTLFTRLLHTNSVILLYSTPHPIQLECIKRKRKSSFFSVSWTQNHQFLLNRNQNSMQQNNSLLLSFWYENVNVGHFVLFFSSSRRMLGFFSFYSHRRLSIQSMPFLALSLPLRFLPLCMHSVRVCVCARVYCLPQLYTWCLFRSVRMRIECMLLLLFGYCIQSLVSHSCLRRVEQRINKCKQYQHKFKWSMLRSSAFECVEQEREKERVCDLAAVRESRINDSFFSKTLGLFTNDDAEKEIPIGLFHWLKNKQIDSAFFSMTIYLTFPFASSYKHNFHFFFINNKLQYPMWSLAQLHTTDFELKLEFRFQTSQFSLTLNNYPSAVSSFYFQ